MIKSSQKFWVVYVCYRIILEQCVVFQVNYTKIDLKILNLWIIWCVKSNPLWWSFCLFLQNISIITDGTCKFLVTIDLSFASTETKYIKLKTKTQNNIVIFGIFHKNYIIFLAFFETIWLKYQCLHKNQQFWFLVF